jgi:hypothetical protein
MVMEVRMSGRDAQMGTGDSREAGYPPIGGSDGLQQHVFRTDDGGAASSDNLQQSGFCRALDAKTRRLVKLGVAAGLASEGGVRYHTGKALHEGSAA